MKVLPVHLTAGTSYFLMTISGMQEQITWALGALGMVFAIGYYAVSMWVAIKKKGK